MESAQSRRDAGRGIIEEILRKKQGKYSYISFDHMAYSMPRGRYIMFLKSDRTMTTGQVLSLKRFLLSEMRAYAGRLDIAIRQPSDQLKQDNRLFEKIFKECIVADYPALVPFVDGCRIRREGPEVTIECNYEISIGPELFKKLGVFQKVEDYFKTSFDMEIHVGSFINRQFDQAETESASDFFDQYIYDEKAAAQVPQKAETAPAPRQVNGPERKQEGKKPGSGGFQGRRRRKSPLETPVTAGVVPVSQVALGATTAIQGEVTESEVRLLSDGKYTVAEFAITDYDSTLPCKIFMTGDHEEALSAIKPGKVFCAMGTLEYDNYKKDNLFGVTALEEREKPVRKDTSEEKRVELHLHTTMSAKDAVTSASAYVAQAAKWGHKAIAITDHGVVQAFPEAAGAGKQHGVKIIYGMEAYMVDDGVQVYSGEADHGFVDEIVVFDIETTGLSPATCGITEIGAVKIKNGEETGAFHTFVNSGKFISEKITELTGITQDMVKDAPDTLTALLAFKEFLGDAPAVAHNAAFDTSFVFTNHEGVEFANDVLDSLAVARAHLVEMKSHKLNKLAEHYKIPLEHHRAVNDARATAQILVKMFEELKEKGISTFAGLNELGSGALSNKARPYHTILLCKNKTGLVNLYRLVSYAHLEFFHKRPRIPKSYIKKYREGLIVGSACEQGELYRAVLAGESDATLKKVASFYDYLEIQPNGNNMFLVREGMVSGVEQLNDINRKIISIGKSLGKMTVATTDAHFLDEKDGLFRSVVMDSVGFKDVDNITPLHFKTTDEMLAEFAYLGEELAREVVITNTNAIADMTEEIELFPGETAMPEVENADEDLRRISYERIRSLYGEDLPELIAARLERELDSIIRNGFAVLYWIAMKLVEKSMSDGYLVGSRGSVGSSLAAYAAGITEVNPLPPHYRCPKCHHSDFNVDDKYGCGVDMPKKNCPICGAEYESDGYDIPFEVFLGIDADKVPDIDLNFSGEYQPTAHKFVEEVFGEGHVFRAGTISAIQDNTAIGFVKKYFEKRGRTVPNAEIRRIAKGCCGVKATTGQHPGGVVIVPKDREVYEFTAIQKPAGKVEGDIITTHFDFNSMHDILIKLDVLGHDNPTIIRMLEDIIPGLDATKIPLDDEATMSLFRSTEALGITPEQIKGIEVGTLGVPEFGTKFVRQMLVDTKPTTMAELVRISGLSHGTDVWLGNAQDLIQNGVTTLSGAICTRDDIMNYLVKKGVEKRTAFFIMESVRKGKFAKHKEKKQEEYEQAMRDAGVEEWFIESCRKIGYMFPKAHAVAYVVMALRIAYCKVHYPKEYYATFFTVRGNKLETSFVEGGIKGILENMNNFEAKGNAMSATEKDAVTVLEMALEMYQRGFQFLPVDIKKSKGRRYTVEPEGIRMPFVAIPSLGEKAADALEQVAEAGDYVCVEDIKRKAKLSQTVIDKMAEMGCFQGLPMQAQISLFDVL